MTYKKIIFYHRLPPACVKEANEAVKATSVVDLEHNVFPDLTDRNTGVVQTAAQAGMTRRSERKWALG